MKKFYVYAIFSSESEEVLYVGKGSGDRIKTSLARLVKKYNSYSLEAKKLVVGLSEEEALQKETQLIAEIQPKENKIASWVREKEHDRFGKASVYFSVGDKLLGFLESLDKKLRVVAGGFEIVLRPLIFGEAFHLMCRKMEDGALRSTFYLSFSDNVVRCSGQATGVVEPSVKNYDTEATLYSVVQNLAQSCFNLINALAEVAARKLTDKEVYWKRISLKDSTVSITEEGKDGILKFFTSVCGMQYFSGPDNKFVGVAKMLGFGFDAYTVGELAAKKGIRDKAESRLCGIVFKKYVGASKHIAFTLSIYDKIAEVEDKVAALRNPEKKPRVLGQNQAMVRELGDELVGRLRVEGQVYPDTFLRGLASRFRALMMQNADKPEWMDDAGWARVKEGQKMKGKNGKVVPDSYYRRSGFLRDSRATEATLRKVIQEMTRQLGLPVIFEAPSQSTFIRRINEEVASFVAEEGREEDVRALMAEWFGGKDISDRALSTTCMPYKLRCWFLDRLGVDVFSCSLGLPRMIRGALKISTLSEQEFLSFVTDASCLLAMDKEMIARAKILRNKMRVIPSSPTIAKVDWS